MKLEELFTRQFIVELAAISTIEGVYAALQLHPAIARLRKAIAQREICDGDISAFVEHLTGKFQKGRAFPHELELSGLATALATVPTAFAKQFLEGLVAVSVMEMPVSPKVAELALRDYLERYGQITKATVRLSNDASPSTAIQLVNVGDATSLAKSLNVSTDGISYNETRYAA